MEGIERKFCRRYGRRMCQQLSHGFEFSKKMFHAKTLRLGRISVCMGHPPISMYASFLARAWPSEICIPSLPPQSREEGAQEQQAGVILIPRAPGGSDPPGPGGRRQTVPRRSPRRFAVPSPDAADSLELRLTLLIEVESPPISSRSNPTPESPRFSGDVADDDTMASRNRSI